MATITYQVYRDTFEGNNVTITPPGIQAANVGDIIRFEHSTGHVSGNITLSGWSSTHFTTTTSASIAVGGSVQRTIKVGASATQGTITGSYSGATSDTGRFQVGVSVDDSPNNYTFTNVTGAIPSQVYTSNPITVAGLGTSDTANISITGTAGRSFAYSKNGAAYTTASVTGGAANGDIFVVRITSATTVSTAVTTTLTIGTGTYASEIFSVTTNSQTTVYTAVPSGIARPNISLSEVKTFFGGPINAANNLYAYVKGGAFVPNIGVNSAVAASPSTLSLDSFHGSGTEIGIIGWPSNKSGYANNTSGSQQIVLSWVSGFGLNLGRANMNELCNFRCTVTSATSPGLQAVNSFTITPSGYGTYSTSNDVITLTAVSGTNMEQGVEGTVTFWAQVITNPSITVSTSATFQMLFFGNI